MFLAFLYALRAAGLKVSTTEWLTLMEALARGHARADLAVFHHLARSLLVKRESDWDRYDQVFAAVFEGVEAHFDLPEELLSWLRDPQLPRALTEEERARLEAMDLETLRREFEERLREQKERHDGGNRWIGTGGTSPFGHGGTHPSGLRIGGPGGGRSAAQVAEERRFRNLRHDRVLDTRQLGLALRRLRRLGAEGPATELDVDATIDRTAREGGEIDLVFRPDQRNRVRVLLLMDVGGSMDPHAITSERLFSAAHAANHFRELRPYYFHNCVYETLYTDMAQRAGVPTADVLAEVDDRWITLIVGDAYMHPFELTQPGGALAWVHHNAEPGLAWLRRIRERTPRSVWLNPESPRIWDAPSIRMVRSVYPMFPLTLDGLRDAVDVLRGVRRVEPLPWPFG
ncbi:MAG: VWA domain-containing protein [Deltaproteobacteria bacterium]|nr:MAG: VWA domain-containing protein [Deltaproteobacteria bacterium]